MKFYSAWTKRENFIMVSTADDLIGNAEKY